MNKTINYTGAIVATIISNSACSTSDSKSAILYRTTTKQTSDGGTQPTMAGQEALSRLQTSVVGGLFNGNVINVPRGRLTERLDQYTRQARKASAQTDKTQFEATFSDAALKALRDDLTKQYQALLPDVRPLAETIVDSHFQREFENAAANVRTAHIGFLELEAKKGKSGGGAAVTIY